MSTAAGSMVWTGDGRSLKLDALLKSGGAGSVYRLQGSTTEVAKIYHASVDHAHYARKVEAMLKLSPKLPDLSDGGKRFVQIAWPEATLRDKQGRFLGFLMPAVDVRATSELECILQEKQARALKLPTGLGAKMTLAANLAAVIAELHAQRHYVVDLKPVNLRFYPQSLYMAMLDCDGFSIQGEGERFAAPQITPDYLAPEFQLRALTDAGEEQQDRFALAVVVFQLLNNGLHPFSGRPTSDRTATDIPGRIAQRAYAYGLRGNPHQSPSLASAHMHMPADLRNLFDRAFEGADAGRPTAAEWRSLLTSYAQRSNRKLVVCNRNAEHQHYAAQSCAACARLALIAKHQSAPRAAKPTARTPTRPNPFARPAASTRPNPFARPSASATTRQPTLPRTRQVPQPYAPLPRMPPTPPPGLLAQLGAWIFGLALRDPRNTLALVVVGVILLVKACSGASTSNADRYAEPPPAAESSASTEVPVLDTNPTLPTVASNKSPPRGGPSWTELSDTETYIRLVSSSLASNKLLEYSHAMAWLYGNAGRRPPANDLDREQNRARFELYLGDFKRQGQLVRRELMDDLAQSLERDPMAADPAFMLGCLSLIGGDRIGAREYFVRTIWADPANGAAWYAFGAISSDDSVAIGAMVNASAITSRVGGFQAEVPNALLDAANIDSRRAEQLQMMAAKLAREDRIRNAHTSAKWEGARDAASD